MNLDDSTLFPFEFDSLLFIILEYSTFLQMPRSINDEGAADHELMYGHGPDTEEELKEK